MDGQTALATDAIDQLDAGAGHTSVVGVQFGDEGKGQIVDALTERFDFVVRYNGGNNAGHSVHIGDEKFALHLVPSGILNPDAINVVGNGVVIDPKGILEEMDGLEARGVKVAENLRLSSRAHVVLHYHKLYDGLMDRALAQSAGDEQKIGTTGRGIGPCYADRALRATAIRMCELIQPEVLRSRLEHIVPLKNVTLGAVAQMIGEAFEPYDVDALFEEYNAYGQRLKPHVCDTMDLLHGAMAGGKRLLFEGANAAMLDIDHGTFPFVTSSNTTSLGIYPGAGIPGGRVGQILGVAKCYTSRVGGGPFSTELFDETGGQMRDVGNEYGTTTGRPRRTGWMDLVAVRYAAALNGCTGIVCTGLSVLCGVKTLKVCVGYEHNGTKLETVPTDPRVLAEIKPVYRELRGFDGPVDGCRAWGQLPAAARGYLEAVERFVGVPVAAVCVGRRRDQIIARGK